MDFGKYKYENAIKAREVRKKQANVTLKEIRFRLKIDKHDYITKLSHVKKFLFSGDKVKIMIQFRGREQQRPEMGVKLLNNILKDIDGIGNYETNPRLDGRNMTVVITPFRKQSEYRIDNSKKILKAKYKNKANK